MDNDPRELDDLYQSNACNDIKEKLHRMIKKNWDPKRYDAPKNEIGNSLSYLNVGTGMDVTIEALANMIASY